jgi:hypothetical protein
MCFGFGVRIFEFPNLIISEHVILINPHIVHIWVSFPFDQILKSLSSAEMLGI